MRIWFFKTPDFSWIKRRWKYFKLCFLALTYNNHSSFTEVIFEPVITLIDFIARWFGFAFVTLVTVLISYVVGAYYLLVIPYLARAHSVVRAAVTIFYGHYLLIMISFHYYKAVRTDPGRPPKDASDRAVTSVCKKCILPKPPRTHHCSVCKNCVLKMDHHCPWINNCVGHFNHRYFISFCIFMWLGTVFVVTSTWPLFHDCFDVPHKVQFTKNWIQDLFKSHSTNDEDSFKSEEWLDTQKEHAQLRRDIKEFKDTKSDLYSNLFLGNERNLEANRRELIEPYTSLNLCDGKDNTYRTNVIFLWLLCMGVTAALGALTAIQFRLVSRGETSIEKLINDKERAKARKLGVTFQNPYDLGFVRNWKMLLDFHNAKLFLRNVVLPRNKLPIGDGLVWNKYVNKDYSDQMYSNGR